VDAKVISKNSATLVLSLTRALGPGENRDKCHRAARYLGTYPGEDMQNETQQPLNRSKSASSHRGGIRGGTQAIQLRSAKIHDAPVLAAAEQNWARTPGLLLAAPEEIKTEIIAERIRVSFEHSRARLIVAEFNGKIAGHAFLEPLPLKSLAHVATLTIVTHAGCEGRGLGKAMIRELISWARRTQGLEKIELKVRASNVRAISLFRRSGFFEEGRQRNQVRLSDGRMVDEITMGLFPKIEMRRLNGSPEDIVTVQRLMEASPRYFLRVQNQIARSNEAREAFAALPPNTPPERKFCFGVYWAGELAGFADVILGYPDASYAYLGLLLFSESYQNQGLGRQAYQLIEEEISTWPDVKTIRLGVADTNDVGGFWRKMGFEPTGRRLPSHQPEIKASIIEMDKPIKAEPVAVGPLQRVSAVFIFVEDIFSSSFWYEKLFGRAPIYRDPNFAAFRVGDQEFCLHPADAKSPHSSGGSIAYWWTDDFAGTLSHALGLGAQLHRGPISISGQRQICQIMDPFGNVIGLEGRMRA
jgi:ribosomal protein S18 acetylase RimI-like enzyme/predicted enzyme related to lactoylglutathione lyase